MGMVRSIWSGLNFHLNEALNFVLHKAKTLPDSGVEAQLMYSDGSVYVHNGAEWVKLGVGGSQSNTETFDYSSEPSDVWTINHNLGRLVIVQTLDLLGNRIEGSVTWDLDTMDSVTVTFDEPMQGYALISYGEGAQSTYEYGFTDSQVWTINHNLGRLVSVQTLNSEGERIEGSVVWDLSTLNTVAVTFDGLMSGTALIL